MLATAWADPFDDPDWWFEVKWDGYRAIARFDGQTNLASRRGLDLSQRFPEVAAIRLPSGWTFDGEIVALDDDGLPDFSLLQAGRPASYVAFDVLESPEGTLIGEPFETRREILGSLDLGSSVIVDEPVREYGTALYRAVCDRGFEGIVAKRAASRYIPGRRSPDWRKVAARHSLRAVVGGWLPGEGARRSSFGSLLVGLWDEEQLRWVGAVGSGFDEGTLGRLGEILAGIERPDAPFDDATSIPRGARWVEPIVKVVVEYKEWTRDLRLRAPVFKGVELDEISPTWQDEGPEAS